MGLCGCPQREAAWQSVETSSCPLDLRSVRFSGYFESMLELWKSGRLTLREKPEAWPFALRIWLDFLKSQFDWLTVCAARSHVLQFLINCFQSLEQDFVRECCLRQPG